MKEKRIEKKLVAAILGMFLLGNSSLSAQEEEGPVEELQFPTKPKAQGYTYNLKHLLEQAEKNIQKVEEEIKQVEIRKRNKERETRAIEHFENGNQLYQEGKLKEAREQWEKTLKLSKDPGMKGYIKEAGKRAKEHELARRKEEEGQRKKERLELERRRQLKKQQDLEQERQEKSKKAAGRRKE